MKLSKLWTPSTRRALLCALCGKPLAARRSLLRPFLGATYNVGPCMCCGGEIDCSECLTYTSATLSISGLSGSNASVESPCETCPTEFDDWNWSNIDGAYGLVYSGTPGVYEIKFEETCSGMDADSTGAILYQEFKVCPWLSPPNGIDRRRYVREIEVKVRCNSIALEIEWIKFFHCLCSRSGSNPWGCVDHVNLNLDACDFTVGTTQTTKCAPLTADVTWPALVESGPNGSGCYTINTDCNNATAGSISLSLSP